MMSELTHLRQQAEKRISRSIVADPAKLSSEEVARMLYELQVYQMELELQNEELRQAQIRLAEVLDKYTDLYDFAPLGYFVLDPEGVIQEVNLAGADQLGLPRSHLLGKPFTYYIGWDSQDQFYYMRRQVLSTGAPQRGELKLVKPDNSRFYAHAECALVPDTMGQRSLRLATIDITARVQAEINLQQAHARLELEVQARTTELRIANEQLSRENEERLQVEAQLQASLQEKEALLKELHHRVKNNLQAVSTLLQLPLTYLQDEQAREIFKASQERIKSMALIHEQLYLNYDLSHIDFAAYVSQLAPHLLRSYSTNPDLISLKLNVEPVALSIDLATPLGIIIHELISNALKYAFGPGQPGEIGVELRTEAEALILWVWDNGVGLPPNISFPTTHSLGLQLVNMLMERLKGIVEIERQPGTSFRFILPRPEAGA